MRPAVYGGLIGAKHQFVSRFARRSAADGPGDKYNRGLVNPP